MRITISTTITVDSTVGHQISQVLKVTEKYVGDNPRLLLRELSPVAEKHVEEVARLAALSVDAKRAEEAFPL